MKNFLFSIKVFSTPLILYRYFSNNNYLLPSIIIGLVLGDAHLSRSSSSGSNVRLEMSFGEKYKEYAEFIANIFKDYMKNPLKSQSLEIKGTNKSYIHYRLKTISSSMFNDYFEMFYELDKEKNKFKKRISPIS
jgi:hypothetical protein